MRSPLTCLAALAALASCSFACGSSPHAAVSRDAATDAVVDGPLADVSAPWVPGTDTPDASAILASRPYALHVPSGYDATKPTPLVVMFHGYSASGALEEAYFGLTATSDANTFLYAYGNGTLDKVQNRFWNATDACCDLYGMPVDDVAYFDAIVQDVNAKYHVDQKRIYAIGHSNGGFMSHRLACDRSSVVAAIVSLAGAQWNDPAKCKPDHPVSILEVHGNADATIVYTGGKTMEGTYPAAATTVADWAQQNGCTGPLATTGQTLDLDSTLSGNETQVQAYGGCPGGADVQLWTIKGGSHIPNLVTPAWGNEVWAFLSAHAKR